MLITWDAPDTIRAIAEPHVKAWDWVVPLWCAEVTIAYNAELDDALATMTAQPEYRSAHMDIGPQFLADDVDPELVIVHELVHIVLEPQRDVFLSLRDAVSVEADGIYHWAEEEYRKVLEAAVTDLSRALIGWGKRAGAEQIDEGNTYTFYSGTFQP